MLPYPLCVDELKRSTDSFFESSGLAEPSKNGRWRGGGRGGGTSSFGSSPGIEIAGLPENCISRCMLQRPGPEDRMLGKLGGGSRYCGGKAIVVDQAFRFTAPALGYVVPDRTVDR